MGPTNTIVDSADLRTANSKPISDFSLRNCSFKSPDLQNLTFRQLGRTATGASIISAMGNFILFIPGLGFPREMSRINAPSVSATVSGLVNVARGLPMGQFTRISVRKVHFPRDADLTVTGSRKWERPFEARIGVMMSDNSFHENHQLPGVSRACQWRAMTRKPLPMRTAKPISAAGRVMSVALAAIDRTCFEFISHFDLLVRLAWLGPRGGANTVLRPDYSSIPVSGLPA